MLIALVAAHFVVGSALPVVTRRLGVRTFFAAALFPLLAFIWLCLQGPAILSGEIIRSTLRWIPQLDVSIDLRMGLVQWVLALIVTGIGALVLFYCRWYFKPGAAATRSLGLLTWFAGTMLGLVTADNLILLYVFWELTTVFSYLLIGNDFTRKANRSAALTALIVTTVGGLAMLVGIVILGVKSGSFSLAAIAANQPEGAIVGVAALLMLFGALSKSALVPFHFWLPGAMAAATPVSAYLHAAAMVKAGVYLVAVLAPMFSGVPGWRVIVSLLGACTMVIGGWRSLRQVDSKLLLAYGTVSQLGFIVLLVGLGTRSAALAGLAMTVAHALFKSTLFLSVGIVDHSTGTRDITKLSGVGRKMPVVAVAALLAAASMAGLPPMLGFVSKEAAFDALIRLVNLGDGTEFPPAIAIIVVLAVVVGSALTMAYTLRFCWGVFATKPDLEPTEVHRPELGMAVSPVILAMLCLVGGIAAPLLNDALMPYADAMPLGQEPHELALWHGFTVPLAISALVITAGIVMFWQRERVAHIQSTFPTVVPAVEWYQRCVRFVDRFAVEVISRFQAGSLPTYLSVILGFAVLAVGTPLMLTHNWPKDLVFADGIGQVVVGVIMCAAAILAAMSRGRIRAVLLVGVTGYGVAMLFQMYGAPDLALTQVLVETVTLVVFLLLLRRMPRYFTDRPLVATRWWRIILAVCVGTMVMLIGIIAPGVRKDTPVSEPLYQMAKEFGYGNNIVNVILVDTRAWDTIGESSVLVLAATGVASLIFLRTRHVKERGRPQAKSGEYAWLRGTLNLDPAARSLIFEVVTRIVFGIMVVVSVWLLVNGHNNPGGGFAGGLVAGMALMVRYLAAGAAELDEAAPIDAGRLLGAGLLTTVTAAVVPALFGGAILQSYEITLDVFGWDEIHLVSSTLFDVGVYLIVVGVLLDYARSLGSGIDSQSKARVAPIPKPGSTVTITPGGGE